MALSSNSNKSLTPKVNQRVRIAIIILIIGANSKLYFVFKKKLNGGR